MPRYRGDLPAVRVYTVCDESKYLIVHNVPSLGCGDELSKLFESYGEVEDCKPMDAEDCEPFTDIFWIKFRHVSNARFAKRKLDDSVFLGNKLQVSYAPQFESLPDTKEKLEGRRKEVMARLNSQRSGVHQADSPSMTSGSSEPKKSNHKGFQYRNSEQVEHVSSNDPLIMARVSSNQDYFPSQSMNKTVHMVREKLNKIQSSSDNLEGGGPLKKPKPDNRRRI
ncbi:RNA-binding protein 48 [Impatiens glandulifera]|uniref:RNA-binding protein 48 n=1 Tax=Impatiens glandulifera TaxID=253017 RepID=UPI001FB15A4A|nr:RNA-binding protein 48 [Impatiens glandulifera]